MLPNLQYKTINTRELMGNRFFYWCGSYYCWCIVPACHYIIWLLVVTWFPSLKTIQLNINKYFVDRYLIFRSQLIEGKLHSMADIYNFNGFFFFYLLLFFPYFPLISTSLNYAFSLFYVICNRTVLRHASTEQVNYVEQSYWKIHGNLAKRNNET